MELEVLPAAKGDCLLLHHSDEGTKRLIVIDGGPSGIYPRFLRPRLLELRQERIAYGLLEPAKPLFIDLLVISHIDDDHINGVLALIEDIANGAPFRIGRIWHNGFTKLLAVEENVVAALPDVTPSITASLSAALDQAQYSGSHEQHDLLNIVASIGQGRNLVALAKKLNIPVNPEFKGATIAAASGKPMVVDGLKITVIGPLAKELDALRKLFAKWLRKHEQGEASTASLLASFSDKSVANLSSIVLLVEKDGKRILLTGDARGDKMIEAVTALKLLDCNGELPVHVFKVPHHGSDRNVTEEFFKIFPAEHYVFSGNGEHGNPERDTFAYLIAARGGKPLTIELTYPPEEIDDGRRADWMEHEKATPFDLSRQGIATFLEAQSNVTLKHP